MAAFYRATLADFLAHSPDEILGALLRSYQHNELQKRQTKAWEKEIQVLKAACAELIRLTPMSTKWSLLLEYPIPRRHGWRPRLRGRHCRRQTGTRSQQEYYRPLPGRQ